MKYLNLRAAARVLPFVLLVLFATSAPASPGSDLEIGRNVHRGNLLLAQPFLTVDDYRTEARFYRKLESSLVAAKRRGWIDAKTIAVFPELIGLYLLAVDEAETVFRTKTLAEAAAGMIQAHASQLKEPSIPIVDPALRMRRMLQEYKAERMARVYQSVFSQLARAFRVTILAGSITLPGPSVRNGRLEVDLSGPIRNTAAVFRPDGALYPEIVVKSFPTKEEEASLGVTRGSPEALPVFQTPAGRLGVVICADSWFPETYRRIEAKGATLLAVISHIGDRKTMSLPWQGYSLSTGLRTPADVEPADVGRLKEGEAWVKYSLPGRLGQTPLRISYILNGAMTFIRGRLWEHDTPGALPLIVRRGRFVRINPQSSIPHLVCVWL